jgi:hypothetical protein
VSRQCRARGCDGRWVKRWLCDRCYARLRQCPEALRWWPTYREGEPTAADVEMLADAWADRCAEVADERRALMSRLRTDRGTLRPLHLLEGG